jgi:hypothetical protein
MHTRKTCLTPSLLLLAACGSLSLNAQNPTVLTWHNNSARTGLNANETILTPGNVNAQTFGKIGFLTVDGKVDAQPLYVPGLKIGATGHNVVIIASEHASVYAFDAQSSALLWHVSLLKSGEATAANGCGQITPEVGITATPMIDLSQGPHGAIYVVNMAVDSSGGYHQRINALDPTNGAQLFGGPTEIHATYPGTGDNSANGQVVFDPAQYAERVGLLKWNGNIITAWTSHCDARPYTGWVMAYDEASLKQTSVLNVTHNGSQGAIWMAGAGLAASGSGVYFVDGNGSFGTTLDSNGFPANGNFGNAFINLNMINGKLNLNDYYATDTTVQQSNSDTDLGSGGVVVLPGISDNSGNIHYLAVGAGKDHNVYLVDQFNMGKYHPNGGYIYQELAGALSKGAWSSPAFFNNTLYYGGVGDSLRAFKFSDAKLVSTPSSTSGATFVYPGSTPSISANGTKNGIVWAVANASPDAILYAFDANNLATELYDSNQSGTRDQIGGGNKFIVPTIANGHVYVGTRTGVAVFGLLP